MRCEPVDQRERETELRDDLVSAVSVESYEICGLGAANQLTPTRRTLTIRPHMHSTCPDGEAQFMEFLRIAIAKNSDAPWIKA